MASPPLPEVFLHVPLAHRGLHDRAQGRIENSLSAARAAIAAGYGIELDVQLSADGEAMAFHDARLDRLTSEKGAVAERQVSDLVQIPLRDGAGDLIPTLPAVLDAVAGRVPVLIELKDQSGCFGPEPETLASAVARAVADYTGPVALMSFNPHSVAHLARLAPGVPRGLTTQRFRAGRRMSHNQAAKLTAIDTFDAVGASFVSHDRRSLTSPAVLALRARGVPILTWTITSLRQEATARRIAHNITFEGYAAARHGPFP